MNERIRELIKEAQVIYNYAPFYGDMDRDPKPLYKLDPEKFAELIVRECINAIPLDMDTQEYYKAMRAIKDTFGVES